MADQIRYQSATQFDPDNEPGLDLSEPVYFRIYGEWTKEAGYSLMTRGRPGPEVLAWEDGGGDLGGTAVLVADNPDLAGDFEADVLDIQASFLSARPTKTLFLRQLGGNTRPEILASFDEGASLMSYVGHGGAAVWASENVLNSWDVASLRAQSRQPLMLTFNCLNGYFVAPNYDSLSEEETALAVALGARVADVATRLAADR